MLTGKQQVQHQHDILVIANERLVVSAPGDEAMGDEANENESADDGEGGEQAEGDEAAAQARFEVGVGVGRWEVGAVVDEDARLVWVGSHDCERASCSRMVLGFSAAF